MFLRLKNLPHQAHEGDICEFFSSFNIPMNYLKIYYKENNKEASVWFDSEHDLLLAFQLNGRAMFGQPLTLVLSAENPSDPTSNKPTLPPGNLKALASDSGKELGDGSLSEHQRMSRAKEGSKSRYDDGDNRNGSRGYERSEQSRERENQADSSCYVSYPPNNSVDRYDKSRDSKVYDQDGDFRMSGGDSERYSGDFERSDKNRDEKQYNQDHSGYGRDGDRYGRDGEKYDKSREGELYDSGKDHSGYGRYGEWYDKSGEGERYNAGRNEEQCDRQYNRSGDEEMMRQSLTRGRQRDMESFKRMPVKNVEDHIPDNNEPMALKHLAPPKIGPKENIGQNVDYIQDPRPYMTMINNMKIKPSIPSNAAENILPDPICRPRSRSPVRRSHNPMRSEPPQIPHPPISSKAFASIPLPVCSMLAVPMEPVPMKQQPYMSLFPNLANGQCFYLGVSRLPTMKTASEVWSWVGGAQGKSEGVILGIVPPNYGLGLISHAFIVWKDMNDLHKMWHKLPIPPKCAKLWTKEDVNLFLQQLDTKCQIWVTNPLIGKDTLLTREERIQIYFDKNTRTPLLPARTKIGLLEDVSGRPNPISNPGPLDPMKMPPLSQSGPVSTTEVSMLVEKATSVLRKLEKSVLLGEKSYMFLFPSLTNGSRFYLELAGISPSMTPSQIWGWLDGIRGKSLGVIFGKVPPTYIYFKSRVFVVFEKELDMLEMQYVIPRPPEQIFPCRAEKVLSYLQQLNESCQIWVTNPKEMKDTWLSLKEREKIFLSNKPGLLGEAPGNVGEAQKMSAVEPPVQPQGPVGMKPLSPGLQTKNLMPLLNLPTEPAPMKPPPFLSLFPSILNGPRFYLETSQVFSDTTASEVWSWADGAQGKSKGVILGRVPRNHRLVDSRAFIVYDEIQLLLNDEAQIPTHVTQCSPAEVNQFLRALDMQCQVLVTNPMTGKDTMLTIQERIDICESCKP